MGSEWKDTTLGSVLELKRGYDLPKSKRNPGGVPIISSSGSSDTHSVAKVAGPGVVTGRYGTIGQVFYTLCDFWPLNTTLYVRDFKGNDEKFIYYFLKTIDYLQYSDKAAVPGVNRNHLHLAEVRVPTSIDEQKAIAHILGTLDEKIELNRQMNATLEAMAQALFKSWFVDFDPVIDNALAAGNPIPEPLHTRAEARKALGDQRKPLPEGIQNQFPSSFVFNDDMGWVPEGWSETAIKDVAKVIKGKSYKSSELSESETALVTLKSFNRGGGYRLDGLKEYTGGFKPEQEVFPGDLVIAYTDVTQAADVIGKPAMIVSDERYKRLVISLDVAVVRPKIESHKQFLYGIAQTHRFQEHTRSHSTGTTVLHLHKDAVPEYSIPLPSEIVIDEYTKFVYPLYLSIDSNITRNRNLEKIRDTLLPKLLSGQLRIPEAEQQVAEAL